MRTLVALTVLMLALAGAVWWKTTGGDKPENVPPTSSPEENVGILTVGSEGEGTPANASSKPSPSGPENASLKPEPPVVPEPEQGSEAEEEEVEPPFVPAPPPSDLTHTVKDGETLYRIVLNAYGTAPEDLVGKVAAANKLSDPSAIDKGQKLKLPVFEGYPAPSAG